MNVMVDIEAAVEAASLKIMRERELAEIEFADERVAVYCAVGRFGRDSQWHLATAQAQWGRHRKRPRKPERWFK